MPVVFDTGALLRPRFQADEFTATKWDNSEVKSKFANDLCRFMAADFKESLFTKALYQRLSMCWGHIAHYAESAVMRTGGVREGMSWLHLTIAASLGRSRSA